MTGTIGNRLTHLRKLARMTRKFLREKYNISEKTIKPTLLAHPFILIAKPNTIKLLEDRGLNYKFDFWNFEYDSIQNHEERMNSIKTFTSKVMEMSIVELKDFNNFRHMTFYDFNIFVMIIGSNFKIFMNFLVLALSF